MPRIAPDLESLCLGFRQAGGKPLRIGIVARRPRMERWIGSLFAYLQAIPGFETILIAAPERGGDSAPGWVTSRVYQASQRRADPFGLTEYPAAPAALGRGEYDVILWLADRDPAVDCRGLARCAVLSAQLGQPEWKPPYWQECAEDAITSEATIYWHRESLMRGVAVRTAETASKLGLYFTENAVAPLTACQRMLASLCVAIREGGEWQRGAGAAEEDCPATPRQYPSSLRSARFAASKLSRSMRLRWSARNRNTSWFIALRENRGATVLDQGLDGFTPVPFPKDSTLMADPFLVEEAGRTWVLFEEVPKGRRDGRLCSAEVLGPGRIGEMNVVYEASHHLSYPCTIRYRNEWFMLPETSGGRNLQLFRLGPPPFRAELAHTLAEGMRLVDTTPVEIDGRWYFFTSTPEPFLETLLFWADRLEGPLRLHPASPVSCSVRNTRGAGHLFRQAGRLYRVSQDCSVGYGYGITINEVTRLTPTEFEERPVKLIAPTWRPGLIATHTWNESARYQAIDGFMDFG